MTKLADLPILFEGSMVVANRSGLKTQTRRHNGLAVVNESPDDWEVVTTDVNGTTCSNHYGKFGALFRSTKGKGKLFIRSPYGAPGGKLWVRETFCHKWDDDHGFVDEYWYRATSPNIEHVDGDHKSPWIPSIHMPRRACRNVLDTQAIRIERLHDITDADAIAEGTPGGHGAIPGYPYAATPVEHFRWQWEKLYGKGSWSHNVWLWVIDYALAEARQ